MDIILCEDGFVADIKSDEDFEEFCKAFYGESAVGVAEEEESCRFNAERCHGCGAYDYCEEFNTEENPEI